MPTTGPSTKLPTPKLTSLSSSTLSYAASGSNGSRSLPGALAGSPEPRPASPIEHQVRLHDLGGERRRRRVSRGGVEDRLERGAGGRRVGDALGVGVDERRRGEAGRRTGTRSREGHPRVAAQLLVAERPARPVETDEERPESRADPTGALEVVLARGHRADPAVVLPDGCRNVAHPAVAHQNDIGVRLDRKRSFDPRDQAAVDAVGVVGALRARAVHADEVVLQLGGGNRPDGHRVHNLRRLRTPGMIGRS